MEVLVRGSESSEGVVGRRKKGVERTLEGWICNRSAACELKDLPSLQNLFMSKSGFTEVRYTVFPFCTQLFIRPTRRNRPLLRQIRHKTFRSILHSLPSNSSQGRKFHYLTLTLVSIPLRPIFSYRSLMICLLHSQAQHLYPVSKPVLYCMTQTQPMTLTTTTPTKTLTSNGMSYHPPAMCLVCCTTGLYCIVYYRNGTR